jgi:RHS repeat-associated protein
MHVRWSRLISAQNAGTDCTVNVLGGNKKFWGNTYTYDAWGNLVNKAKIGTACAGENLSLTADAHNWIHATGGSDYLYDAAGNMTFNATPPTQNYTYDQENRLTGAAGYAYTYDGDGNRVRKSNSSTGTLYWYMTPGIVGESDLSGNLTDEYIFFGGERVARKSTNGVFYYFSDHLKTASVITDASGNIKSESDFYPWGGELQFVANDSNHYKFTGKERDSETQLDYFGARYYSNGLGRWVSADWATKATAVPYAEFADPQSLNLYGFVGGNPASKADRDGHECNTCQKAWNWLTSNHSATASTPNYAISQSTAKSGPLTVTAGVGTAQASASASYGKNTSVSASVSAAAASATINEGTHSTTQISALSVDAHASAGVSTGGKTGTGISISAGANANVLAASQTETVKIGPVTISGSATGNVGVGANASLAAGTNGVSASAGLTPGYGGGLAVSVTWGGLSASGGASGKGTIDTIKTTINKPEIKAQ